MVKSISHIGIAVNSLEETIPLYRDVFGLEFHGEEVVEEQKVKVAMFDVNGVHIELLEPTSPESPIAKFLEKNGPGMHHICYNVDSVDDSLKEASEKGIRLIDQLARIGAGGSKIGFLHPKSTLGVLTELNSKG